MKAQRILFIAICLLFSCDKETSPPVNPSLVGTWKLYSSCGGFAGTCTYAPPTTNVRIIFTDTEIIETDKPAVAYEVISKEVEPSITTYKVSSDQQISYIAVHDNTLDLLSLGDFVVSYKRVD